MPDILKDQYRVLKTEAKSRLREPEVAELICEMVLRSRHLLDDCDRVSLTSENAKRYFSFERTVISRPINVALYVEDANRLAILLNSFRRGFAAATPEDIVLATYSIAFSVFAANDVYQVGRKASATFFEVLIGHIFSRALGISPRKKVRIPESGADLPTDYVFDPGPRSRKIHLPIKTSTRERGVQAWVHQLVLDRIFGNGQYRGIFVIGSETKRDAKTGAVIEICVPGQLQMFQSRVAEITRIYYLDPPVPYLALARPDAFPRLEVKMFGLAIGELPGLLHG